MNDRQEKSAMLIMDLLLSLPWEERPDVWAAIEYNDTFCVHCGIGNEVEPNKHCQCTNDE